MSPSQVQLYWREWSAVRREAPQADRHELHRRALGYDASHQDFSNDEFDLVLAEFRALSRPADLRAQLRQLNQVRKRLVWKVTVEQVELLAALMDGEPTERRASAERYVLGICRDRFGVGDITQVSAEQKPQFDGDRSPVAKSDLEQLRDTLAARISALRCGAGISVHDLYQRTELKCRFCSCAGAPARMKEVAA